MQVLIDIPDSARPAIAFVRGKYNEGKQAQIVVDQNQVGEIQVGLDGEGNPIMQPVYESVMGPNPDYMATDEAYIIRVVNKAVDSYAIQANVPEPLPDPDPVIINGVPQQVTRRQAIQALINQGLYASVQPAIDAISNPTIRATMQNEWSNSQMFERQRPSLIMMAQAIGIVVPSALDALFIYAAGL